MITLLHTEVAARELHAKLLLAVLAASRGHVAVVADSGTLMRSIGVSRFFRRNLFHGAIFHTKSLTPSPSKIERHKSLVAKGLVITSQDEEVGLQNFDYESFAAARFSAESIDQCGALFTWGRFDDQFLRARYPELSNKIFLTGSPRADLWQAARANLLEAPLLLPKRPFLLVSSTMGFPFRPLQKSLEMEAEAGYFLRDESFLAARFDYESQKLKLMYEFIEAVRGLAKDGRYDIVLRPHPTEDLAGWQIFFTDVQNVHVIREGTITQWVPHAFAVLHNGCMTALEAVISGKPVLAYTPLEREYGEFSNSLGERAHTQDELANAVDFHFRQFDSRSERYVSEIPVAVSDKVLVDENQLAAEKIVRVWEKLSGPSNVGHFPWLQVTLLGLPERVRDRRHRRLSAGRASMPQEKFPRQDFKDIVGQVNRYVEVLGLDRGIKVRRIHDRCFVVSPSRPRSAAISTTLLSGFISGRKKFRETGERNSPKDSSRRSNATWGGMRLA